MRLTSFFVWFLLLNVEKHFNKQVALSITTYYLAAYIQKFTCIKKTSKCILAIPKTLKVSK